MTAIWMISEVPFLRYAPLHALVCLDVSAGARWKLELTLKTLRGAPRVVYKLHMPHVTVQGAERTLNADV